MRPARAPGALIFLACAFGLHAPPAGAQVGRLLGDAAVTQREDHLDLALEFSCTMRYQSHTPASEGPALRVMLVPGPDCAGGGGLAERLRPADDPGLVRGIELAPGLAGGVELTVSWNRLETWVLAPASGMRGLRIRVLRRRAATVRLDTSSGVTDSFAVNLESSRESVAADAVAVARERLKLPVYVSEVVVEGDTWQRLRAGPFTSQREAEAALRRARTHYPRAWLAIDDERSGQRDDDGLDSLPAASGASVPRPAGGERRADPGLDERLARARRALGARRLDEAIEALTQILVSPDYARRAEAQELLGLARERRRQLAHAKAEYEEYLRRYPDGAAAERVRTRLHALRRASIPGRRGSGGGSGADDLDWQWYGYAAQLYRRDDTLLRTDLLDSRRFSRDAVFSDLDFVARRRGQRFGLAARASGGYTKDLQSDGRAGGARLANAYLDVQDRELGWGARAGRQSRGMAGVLGSFDGLLANWQAGRRLRLAAVVGRPVDSSSDFSSGDRRFVGLGTDWQFPGGHWDVSLYAIQQQYAGESDRQSLGTEWRYLGAGRSLIAMLDYDLHFAALNHAFLLGSARLPAGWNASFSASQQRSPTLGLRNALLGQGTRDFDVLRQRFTISELEEIAADRSAQMRQVSLGASRPWGDRVQVFLDVSSLQVGATAASGGVEAIPAQGSDLSLGGELLVSSLFLAGDVQSFALRVQQGGFADVLSLGLGSRWPVGGPWRLMVRARVDQRRLAIDGSTQWLYLPSLRLDRATRNSTLEIEVGTELVRRDVGAAAQRADRLFFSLGYRLSFDSVRP